MSNAVNFDTIGITNDIMFGSAFRDGEKCKELLQRIVGFPISELTIVEEQKTMKWMRKRTCIKRRSSYDVR